MLLALSELRSFTVMAADGEGGSIHDFFLDDATWRVTHVAIATGTWLFGHKVLVRAQELGLPDLRREQFRLEWSHDQIKAMPPYTAPPGRSMTEFAEWQVEGPGVNAGGAPEYSITDFLTEGCWRVRYLCVEVGDVISPRKRAVPVQRLAPPHTDMRILETPLVKSVIQNGPEIGALRYVNRGVQLRLEKYYASFG